MLNAAKNTANKNSKKKKKDATSAIQGCEPRDCTVKGIQSSPKHNRQRLPHHCLQPCALRSQRILSQSAGGQPPLQSSSTMCTQSAGAQPPARPSPSKTGASLLTSLEGPHIIAYVHNLSPLKRDKQNTIDYTTLTLQTDATTTQPALC